MSKSFLSALFAGWVACTTAAVSATQPCQGVVVGNDVASETLDSLVGTCMVGTGFEIRVWRQGERLMLQATGQDAWPLVAESETVFRVPRMDARITFGVDAQGKADHLVVLADTGKRAPCVAERPVLGRPAMEQ